MKPLIVLGLFPLISAFARFPSNPFSLYSGQAPNTFSLYSGQDQGKDLGFQARIAADSLISILRNMAADPKAASTIESAFSDESSVCLKSMDEVNLEIVKCNYLFTSLFRLSRPSRRALNCSLLLRETSVP